MNQIARCDAADCGLRPELISPAALQVIETLQAAGYKAYVVGGSIRDILCGGTPKDFDVATDARPHHIVRHFRRSRIIGKRFKIVHVRWKRECIEVTTFRSMLQPDALAQNQTVRNGMVIEDNEYGSLEEDMMRRDFTANAIYYDPFDNRLIAHLQALPDVRQGRLRFIGDACRRYREDPVRMLRAVRFVAKTGLQLDAASSEAIVPMAPLLREVAPARLFEEVIKMLHCGAAVQAYSLLQHHRLFAVLFPLAAQALEHDTDGKRAALLHALFASTDQRITNAKPVIPAFAVAVVLWLSLFADSHDPAPSRGVSAAAGAATLRRHPTGQELEDALYRVLDAQNDYVMVPRRVAAISLEICLLQTRFEHRKMRSIYYLLEHLRFRAAYDFFCLRATAGLTNDDTALWWTRLQEMNAQDQRRVIHQRARSGSRARAAHKH